MNDQLRKCGHPLGTTSWCPDCELQEMRSKRVAPEEFSDFHLGKPFEAPPHLDDRQSVDRTKRDPRSPAILRYHDTRPRDEAVQPLRERNFGRVVKGAQELDLSVDDLSNRQRRLLAAVTDLPEPFPTTREHKEGTQLSRHLTALRLRLDWLVRLEEEHGDGQRGVHQSRAERNALIFVLAEQAERAGAEASRPSAAPPGKKYERRYIEMVEDMALAAIEDGYTVTQIGRPCVLMHQKGEDIAPIEVPVGVWFAVRAYMRARMDT